MVDSLASLHAAFSAWIATVLGDIPVALVPPGSLVGEVGVNAHLIEVLDRSNAGGGHAPPPIRLGLRFLVTAVAPAPIEAQQLVVTLMLAALQRQDAEVETVRASDPLWQVLQAAPRPAFILQIPMVVPRRYEPGPPVREVVVQTTRTRPLAGMLLGPEDVPLAGAEVELLGLDRRVRTDARGAFAFAGIPESLPEQAVRLRAKGKEAIVKAAPPAAGLWILHWRDLAT